MMDRAAFSSGDYWEARYHAGGTSGAGSYGRLAKFKADFINAFVADNRIASVLDFGCGDGNLFSLLRVPAYVGVDISPTTLARCAARFAGQPECAFLSPDHLGEAMPADLALSIDVIFHLVEDAVFDRHISDLFAFATRFVVIYASNFDSPWPDQHVRHRRFSDCVTAKWPDWRLLAHVPNRLPYDRTHPDTTSFADFFVYGCTTDACIFRVPTA